MELSTVAELQVVLEGVSLPSGRSALLGYAARQGADAQQLALLRRLPERRYDTIDEVAEELVQVQPEPDDEVPHAPREESGDPPGREAYTQPHPERGAIRA